MLIPDKRDSQAKCVIRNKESHYMVMTASTEVSVLNQHAIDITKNLVTLGGQAIYSLGLQIFVIVL